MIWGCFPIFGNTHQALPSVTRRLSSQSLKTAPNFLGRLLPERQGCKHQHFTQTCRWCFFLFSLSQNILKLEKQKRQNDNYLDKMIPGNKNCFCMEALSWCTCMFTEYDHPVCRAKKLDAKCAAEFSVTNPQEPSWRAKKSWRVVFSLKLGRKLETQWLDNQPTNGTNHQPMEPTTNQWNQCWRSHGDGFWCSTSSLPISKRFVCFGMCGIRALFWKAKVCHPDRWINWSSKEENVLQLQISMTNIPPRLLGLWRQRGGVIDK